MSLSRWDAPNGSYTSHIPPGTAAFRKVTGEFFGFRTEVVRDESRCQQQRSEHCEAGAVDEFPGSRAFFDWCVKVADPLGVQSVIYNHRVIGFGNPNERAYGGADPHTGHTHTGLNRWARANLTEQMVRSLLPGQEDDLPYTEAQLKAIVEAAIADSPVVLALTDKVKRLEIRTRLNYDKRTMGTDIADLRDALPPPPPPPSD